VADLLTPVSAVPQDRRASDYAFLLESVEGGEQIAPVLVPRQGSVPDPPLARWQDDLDRAGEVTESDQPFVAPCAS
jgi:hypothetical protein